ncbi:hypothetical protein [Streptomyces sp. So13.3]|uniref:hypothetical protein n=1 Tax=Streptomyces sp. So13.3 TaxID=2136173 RepID=UPI001FD46721|nr:hypothetical protein [Streptomyces sp. So13.3]
MTPAPTTTLPLYEVLGAQYERALARHGINAAMLTHKWQRADLRAPHSDLDVRVLLESAPADWREWNHHLAAAHADAVIREPRNRRLLEHPPGFAFTLAEVHQRRISPPELATWSLIHGHEPTLQRWKSHAQMVPWTRQDERFYRGILDSRLNGRYQLAADSVDNVSEDLPGYRRHCVAWHYLAPCWFAAASLATRTRCPGKSAALTQWHPAGLERHAEMFLRHAGSGPPYETGRTPAIRDLLRAAHIALDAAMHQVPAPADGAEFEEAEGSRAMAWTMTAGMLRVRVARWLYYLDPPRGAITGYLITREAKELRAATEVLRSLASDGSTPEQSLAARMADILPAGPTTAAVLRDALTQWARHHALVEDFLSAHAA